MISHAKLIAASCAALALPVALAAQQPRTLPAPDASHGEPFSFVSGLRELAGGRVIVADARDKIVQLVDLAKGSATKLGREGSGPEEFGLPFSLLAAPGDSTLLFDPVNQRYLVIAPDGKLVTTFRVETASTQQGSGPVVRMGMNFPRTSDARGRLYFESPAFSQSPDGTPRSADSAAITRYDRASRQIDTIAWVALAKNNTQVSGGQGNMRMMVGVANPLTPRDEWTVFPDGRVAVVRASDYHVDWVLPNGTKRASPPIKYDPIRMTAADQKEEEARRNRARQGQLSMRLQTGPEGVQRSATMGPGPDAPPLPPLTDWPSVKPPFRAGQASVLARPNGELWVRRTEPAGAKGTLYDVINAQGAVTHQVRIGDKLTLAGFGNGTVYTTLADEDDLLTLQRHRMP